jgi:hypothetical protein
MNKKKLTIIIGLLLSQTISANEQKLIFFKDLTHYKEKTEISLNDKTYIELSDTAVLDSVQIQVYNDKNERINLKSLEIIEQSENNIFKVNKNSKIFINEKEYILLSNGGDFLKVLKNNMTTYIPKNKIESISFEKDINGKNHLVKLIGFKTIENLNMEYSYTMGDINWKPKYDLYLLKNNKATFDYNIQIDNKTNRTFKDVEMTFISEPIKRFYQEYSNSENDSLFSNKKINQVLKYPINDGLENLISTKESSKIMMAMSADNSNNNFIEQKIEGGKRILEFSGKVNLPSNTDSSFSYLMDKEFKYIKNNNYILNYDYITSNKKSIKTPTLEVSIDRKDSQYHIPLSEGVVRIFSNKKTYENQLLQEDYIEEKQKNENLYFDLGNNHDINIFSKEIKNDINTKIKFVIKGKDYGEEYKRINNRRSQFDYIHNKEIEIKAVSFKTESTKINEDETLKISTHYHEYLTTDINVAKKIQKEITKYSKYRFGKKEDAQIEYEKFINKIKSTLNNKNTYSEKDLKNNKKTIFYVVSFQ